MDNEKTNGSLLGDLTFTQVAAGAAASAASFALAKQTGILGSVIGAAVGSIAATIAGQIFTSMIDRSVEGIRSIESSHQSDDPAQLQPQHAVQAQTPRRGRTVKHALIALAVAAAAGLAAVWVYSVGVDIFTEGKGIGTQAPVIEYVMAPQDYATPSETEAVEEEEKAADEAQTAEAGTTDTAETTGELPAETETTTPEETPAAEPTTPETPSTPVTPDDTASRIPLETETPLSTPITEGTSSQG